MRLMLMRLVGGMIMESMLYEIDGVKLRGDWALAIFNPKSPCNHRGFLFLHPPSTSPKRLPIPGTTAINAA